MRSQPKKNLNRIKLDNDIRGNRQRRQHAENIVENAPIFPKPLEYTDIDDAFFKFVENELDIQLSGKSVPTFKLFSGQRFSEYTQTWQHSDENNNLLMNFKTVSRSPNPDPGENQGGLWNIPGDRHYTILQRSVLEDDGKEVYEIYSMKQPYAVNLSYRIGFLTNEFGNINIFNAKLNELFKSRQYYLLVNGYYIPMIIDDISDDTRYGIEERKFFAQAATIKVMAYIIHESDFQVDRYPKDIRLGYMGEKKKKKSQINIDEFDDSRFEYRRMDVFIDMNAWDEKVEFVIDSDMVIEELELNNIRNYRVFVNKEPVYTEKGFSVKENDEIRIKIFPLDITQPTNIVLHGYNPNVLYNTEDTPEFVSDEIEKYERIDVD